MSLIPEADPQSQSQAMPIGMADHGDYGALGLAGGKISSLQSTISSLSIELQQTKLDLANKSTEAGGLAYHLEIAQYQNAELGNELVQLKDQYHELTEQLSTAIEERDGVFKDMVNMSSRHTSAMEEISNQRNRLEEAIKEMGAAMRIGMKALDGGGGK